VGEVNTSHFRVKKARLKKESKVGKGEKGKKKNNKGLEAKNRTGSSQTGRLVTTGDKEAKKVSGSRLMLVVGKGKDWEDTGGPQDEKKNTGWNGNEKGAVGRTIVSRERRGAQKINQGKKGERE